MAGIKISQLATPLAGTAIANTDVFPVARGVETFKLPANQIVTGGFNLGNGIGMFKGISTNASTTLQFYSLTGTDENISFNIVNNTLVFNTSAQNPIKFTYYGNGTTTTYAIAGNLSKNVNNYRVDIDGVLQEPGVDYTLAGSNIQFSVAPPLSGKIVVVTNNLVKTVDALPAPNTITYDMFAASTLSLIGTLVGASPWRFVTSNFSLTASERVATNAAASLTGILPTAPTPGTMVTVADGAYNWKTYNLFLSAAQPIQGVTEPLICNVSNKVIVLVYTGTTWSVLT